MTLDTRLQRLDRRVTAHRLGGDGPAPLRLGDAADVLALVEEAANEARADRAADPLDRARTLGYLAGIALKTLEQRDLTARVEALERVLKQRRTGR